MRIEGISYLALALVSLTSLTLLIVPRWRWSMVILALQYLGVSVLVSYSWPLPMAAAKLMAGWITVTVLWIAQAELSRSLQEQGIVLDTADSSLFQPVFSGRLFRLFAAALVALVVVTIVPTVAEWIPGLRDEQAYGALLLLGLGLLHLGLTAQPIHVIVGLLTVLSGFEIIYAVVEISALVQGLLAAVNLGLALAGAYLILTPNMGEAR